MAKQYYEIINEVKAKYHRKFRRNTDHNKDYKSQLLERALKEYGTHKGFNCYNGPHTPNDRIEIIALNDLIKFYQANTDRKVVHNVYRI